jgi:hypothetical protein
MLVEARVHGALHLIEQAAHDRIEGALDLLVAAVRHREGAALCLHLGEWGAATHASPARRCSPLRG